jgi:hypothetical protein
MPSQTDAEQHGEEKREVKKAFLRVIGVSVYITTIVVMELALALLWNDVWLALAGIPSALLLFGFVPITIGEYPFLSSRAMRGPLRYCSPIITGLLLLGVLVARVYFPLTFLQAAGWLSPVLTAIVILGVPSVTLAILAGWIRGLRRQVEVGVPKWLTFVDVPPGPTWVVPSQEIWRRLGGVPITITNKGKQPVVFTQIWLEWFAPIMVPRGYFREKALRGQLEHVYHKQVIQFEQPTVVRPKDAFLWVLTSDKVRQLYELLRKQFVEPFLGRPRHGGSYAVMIAVTAYDEYSDRFYSSPSFRLELVLFGQGTTNASPANA